VGPRNWKGRIFSLLSFFFCPPTIDTIPLQSLACPPFGAITQQNVPRADEIHRHFFIFLIMYCGLFSKKDFISCPGSVGYSKGKKEINTALKNNLCEPRCTSFSGLIRLNNFRPSIPEIIVSLICLLRLLAMGWTKAEKMQDHIFGGFFVLRVGILQLQKIVHPEGCVLLQLQDKGLDKKCDKISGLHFF
jgi:hypothetical protein